MTSERQQRLERLYEEKHGKEALERQKQAAKNYHWCCAEPIDGPHHELCSKFVPEDVPDVIEGQESLL